ncbi:hypothetical protein F5887DRAFT_1072882 [Amanita rubescens]|nr:hypothetical protein F5887DRAFT_1072882 [Amanita rubescens]
MQPNGKRTDEGEGERSAKRRRLVATTHKFLDIEAKDNGSEGKEISDELDWRKGFIDDTRSELWECRSSDDDTDFDDDVAASNDFENVEDSQAGQEASVAASGGNDNFCLDHRMAAVINRYESTSSGSRSQVPNFVENENINDLAKHFMRMPTADDPDLWRVRVWEGAEEECFFLLHRRLQAHSDWAVSVFLPPNGRRRQWICVESTSRENVERLCLNLSTIPHPLEILFVPAEQRVEWIDWHYMSSPIKSPSWVRLKRMSELQDLVERDLEFDERLLRYANDLAYVKKTLETGFLLICLVPRLLPPIERDMSVEKEQGEKERQRRKRVPRLLHPKALGGAKETMDIAHPLDPNVWWVPKRIYELDRVARSPGVYKLAKPKSKKTLRGGDCYMPPFAYYPIPVEGVHAAGVVPRLAELRLFTEGMTIGAKELKFQAPDAEFIRWTYENHQAAPVEIGQKVEANLKTGMIRAVVEGIRFEQVIVRMMETEEEIEVEASHVRRHYDVGDWVKVNASTWNLGREGCVTNTIDDHIDVFDHRTNEEFAVKCWQVVPWDRFKCQTACRIQAGDMVQVINPLSEKYHKTGTVYNVTTAGVEFTVPPWFLEVDNASRLPMRGSLYRNHRTNGSYDHHYEELVNTWVVVSGNHAEKGLYGRIRAHLGRQIMSVEASSGSRVLNIHVDFLITAEQGGRDLREYHVGRYPTPAGVGYAIPSFIRQPEPSKEKTLVPASDGPAIDPEDDALVVQTSTQSLELGTVDNQGGSVSSSPLVMPMISYKNQVLPANWLMKHELALTKRVYAYVRNSEPNAFNAEGFAKGVYEGDRVLVLSGEKVDAIEVHARKRKVIIPGWFLFPQMPTGKGQDVVVISGDRAGEVFLTRKPKEDGSFQLGRRGFFYVDPHSSRNPFSKVGGWAKKKQLSNGLGQAY